MGDRAEAPRDSGSVADQVHYTDLMESRRREEVHAARINVSDFKVVRDESERRFSTAHSVANDVVALVLPEQLAKDGRVSGATRPWLAGWERMAWEFFRHWVLQLTSTSGGGKKREWIAQQLGISPSTLDDWVSPEGKAVPRFGAVMVLVGALLPEKDREWAVRYLAQCMGLEVVGRAAASIDQAPLHLQCMQIGAAMGTVHHRVLLAQSPGSEGGVEISEGERRALMRDAETLAREAHELALTVRRMGEVGDAE